MRHRATASGATEPARGCPIAMRAIWSQEQAEFHGEHVDFAPLYSWPKPPSGPQVLVGGGRKPAARKIAEYADGWLPIYPGEPGALIDEVTAIREQLGREVPVTVMNAPADKDVLATLADAGIERALLELPRADRDATLRTLDGHTALLT